MATVERVVNAECGGRRDASCGRCPWSSRRYSRSTSVGRAYPVSASSSLFARLRAFFLGGAGSLVWMRECRVSSSEREKRFSHEGNVQMNGFSPVCVRMCRVCVVE
jgi:hypothetical protein